MRIIVLTLGLGAFALSPASAITPEELPEAIEDFVSDEASDASPAAQEAMVACIADQFSDLDEAELQMFLDQDDFEDTLDALVIAYPESENAIEACLEGVATAQGSTPRDILAELVADFVAEERGDAEPDRKATIEACLIAAYHGIRGGELAGLLAQDDFEDSIDALLDAYPDREEIIEVCEDI